MKIPENTLTDIENAARESAHGENGLPPPTEAQLEAGNFKKGKFDLYGLTVAIEYPRGSLRTGVDKSGKPWSQMLAAHYGYLVGVKAADGHFMDCFLGTYPSTDVAYCINQYVDGKFDEHKLMLGFLDEDSARQAYLGSHERGWKGLHSMIPLSISQLKWWLKYSNTTKELDPRNLPFEGARNPMKKTFWNDDATPFQATLDSVIYYIRCNMADGEIGDLILDAVTEADILGDPDNDAVLTFDALITPYAMLERKMNTIKNVMNMAGKETKVQNMQITKPFSQKGSANVAAIFELSDGQTVTIYFHNPDTTPKKITPADELISWKWLLNKKDITIVVAPEKGQDLNVREVARRVIKLAEKNSPAFARANTKKAETAQAIEGLKTEIVGLETTLKEKTGELEVAKMEAESDLPTGLEKEYLMTEREKLVNAISFGVGGKGNLEWAKIKLGKVEDALDKNYPGWNNPEAEEKPVQEAAIDPTTVEGYELIAGNRELEDEYQDDLDALFNVRVGGVRNSLKILGWSNGEKYWPMTKGAYSLDANFKRSPSGGNNVGVTYILKDGSTGMFSADEFRDDLTKTPAELAAEIDKAASVEAGDQGKPVSDYDVGTGPDVSQYQIGKSTKNYVKVRKVEGGYLAMLNDEGTRQIKHNPLAIPDIMAWLADMMFVGGGTPDMVRQKLKLSSGVDVLNYQPPQPEPVVEPAPLPEPEPAPAVEAQEPEADLDIPDTLPDTQDGIDALATEAKATYEAPSQMVFNPSINGYIQKSQHGKQLPRVSGKADPRKLKIITALDSVFAKAKARKVKIKATPSEKNESLSGMLESYRIMDSTVKIQGLPVKFSFVVGLNESATGKQDQFPIYTYTLDLPQKTKTRLLKKATLDSLMNGIDTGLPEGWEDNITFDDATNTLPFGDHEDGQKEALSATKTLIGEFKTFLKSECAITDVPPMAQAMFKATVMDKAQAKTMLQKLIDMEINQKGGMQLSKAQANRFDDFQADAQTIADYLSGKAPKSGRRNMLRTRELKAKYPDIDNQATLDAVGGASGKMALNLFIEGEDSNLNEFEAEPEQSPQPIFETGQKVRIAKVSHAGNPNHDKMIGKTGTIKSYVKSRDVYKIQLDDGDSWEAIPENIEAITDNQQPEPTPEPAPEPTPMPSTITGKIVVNKLRPLAMQGFANQIPAGSTIKLGEDVATVSYEGNLNSTDGKMILTDASGYQEKLGYVDAFNLLHTDEAIITLPTQNTPLPEPTPQPEPDMSQDQAQQDRAFLQSVIDQSRPDMLSPELADLIEAVYMRNESDPEMMALAEKAIFAYQAAIDAVKVDSVGSEPSLGDELGDEWNSDDEDEGGIEENEGEEDGQGDVFDSATLDGTNQQHWITTKTGSHLLLQGNPKKGFIVRGGAGGKFNGQKWRPTKLGKPVKDKEYADMSDEEFKNHHKHMAVKREANETREEALTRKHNFFKKFKGLAKANGSGSHESSHGGSDMLKRIATSGKAAASSVADGDPLVGAASELFGRK